MKKSNLVSINKYATISKVTGNAIRARIKKGDIIPVIVKEPKQMIDVEKYPPVEKYSRSKNINK